MSRKIDVCVGIRGIKKERRSKRNSNSLGMDGCFMGERNEGDDSLLWMLRLLDIIATAVVVDDVVIEHDEDGEKDRGVRSNMGPLSEIAVWFPRERRMKDKTGKSSSKKAMASDVGPDHLQLGKVCI